jgi:hypothetical protein
MAHPASWPIVREDVLRKPGIDPAGTACWRFHQPANVVLLCCNCHALFDDPKVPEVDLQLLLLLRERARFTAEFGDALRRFVCREMGLVPRRGVSMAGLAPLFGWLREAVVAGTLSLPHRFVVRWGSQYWHADLAADRWQLGDDGGDRSWAYWDGSEFLAGEVQA